MTVLVREYKKLRSCIQKFEPTFRTNLIFPTNKRKFAAK